MFSSASGVWSTPQSFYDKLNAEFRFTLDAAANAENAKCSNYLGPGSQLAEDALTAPWLGTVWLNPPYGRGIGQWVQKAADEAAGGATVVALVPARTDTKWWHEHALRAHQIRFVKGRIHFGDAGAAPFPSAVLVFFPWQRATKLPVVTWDTEAA